MSGGSMSLVRVVETLQGLVHFAVALAFIVVCVVKARHIGVGGAWLLVAVALLDVATLLVFTIGMRVLYPSSGSSTEAVFAALQSFDIVTSVVSVALVIAAFALMRRPPVPS
jgi:hypothetical protein